MRLAGETVDVYGTEFICWLHREFYQRLPEPLHWAKTLSGQTYRIEPGRLRDFMVDVGRHTPPQFGALPRLLSRFNQFYGSREIIETDRLTAIAAAHHRMAWIHPFGDGNGRVIRLHSQALMIHHGLDGGGLWTLSRGLARQRQRYYDYLQAADLGRRNVAQRTDDARRVYATRLLSVCDLAGPGADIASLPIFSMRYMPSA